MKTKPKVRIEKEIRVGENSNVDQVLKETFPKGGYKLTITAIKE